MKRIKILLVLIFLFISISAVSAEGNFTALQNDIDSSTDSIDITQDYAYDNTIDYELNSGILINKSDFTINGNGHTIDGSNQARIFDISGNNIIISNIIFINGNINGNLGGALHSSGSITLNNVTFKDNIANCGGAISVSGQCIINNAIFANNTAREDGGAIIAWNKLTINNASFTDNTASASGGAIYVIGETAISNSVFANNQADFGGAINTWTNTIIDNTTLKNNKGESGGAIYAAGKTTINNALFSNNAATENGGAISTRDESSITNTKFSNNKAIKNGGAIFTNGNSNQINCTFENNSANNGGAVYFNNEIKNNIIQSIFNGNNATRAGAAIYVKGPSSNNTLTSEFNNNIAKEASGGGIFFYKNAENNKIESLFTNNIAAYGAGMFFYSESNNNKINSEFKNNTALSCGGALFFYSKTNNNSFKGNFINNTAKGLIDTTNANGGAITFKNTSKNCIFDCNFTGNTAILNGGAVNYRLTPYNITFKGNFIANNAPRGGGINFFDEFNNVTFNCNFIANNATKGGAICVNKEEKNESTHSDYIPTVANCNFKNNNAVKGGAIYFEGNGTVKDCNFVDNHAEDGGAIYVSKLINLTDSIFDSNYALKGADLYFKQSEAPKYPNTSPYSYIENTTFKNAKNIPQASVFVDIWSNTTFKNCLFENITGEYGSALYYNDNSYGNIINSRFENLYANKSGGAIALISGADAIIKNSTFINCKSSKNGGAIYADENSWTAGNLAPVFIYESNFINCSSDFGGSIAHVGGGSLNLYGCNFTQNCATYLGGAVYASYVMNINFANNTFNNNKLSHSSEDGFFGSAVYSLFSSLTVNNSTFLNNLNNSIYCYGIGFDGKINITNSYFENNKEAIRAVHVESLSMRNNTFVGDKIKQSDSDEFLRLIMSGPAIELELLNNTINVTTLPARFDSRDWGWVSPVKNQGFSGACWCFATCAALESALLKATGIEYDISEQNMQKMLLSYSKYGNDKMVEPGQPDIAVQYILSWLGVIPEEYDTFDMIGKITKDYVTPENIHIQDAVILYANKTNMSDYKKAIIEYGAVTTDIVIDYQAPYFNANTSAAYYNKTDGTVNHSVTIVGWDDNYPKENFLITPAGNGAWIIKNSYGPDKYDKGYIYVSYYDTSIVNTTNGLAFSIENTEKYSKNYQTDFGGEINYLTGNISYKNSYSAVSSDLISAIGTYFNDMGEEYSFDVYVNDILKLTQNGSVTFAGFHTIKLENEIPIKMGDNFTVIMTKNSVPLLNYSKIYYKTNTSFYNKGSGWIDTSLENLTAVLKVYTKDLAIYTEDLVKIYKNASKFEANVGAANETVTFEINGGRYTRVSDENGTARMAINLNPGNYTIKTTYNNFSVENNIEVLPTLIAENLVKYFRNASQFYISLIDGASNPVSGVNITMNINGVFYNRLTNENGTAKLNINLEPGEYILTALDPLTGLQMSYNITVLSTLNASDLEMKYKDGSTFNVTVLDGQGNPLANAKVTFNVNGVFYNRISDSKGIAKLNINLMAGEYIITSEYDDLRISNTITIRD